MTQPARPGTGTLADLRVVELGGIGPIQYGAMLLADHGADVVRITRPGHPFPNRPDGVDLLDRGKRLVALDLRRPDDQAAALRLAVAADVVVEGWRPGVAERLGVGPAEITARNPRSVYVRMTGWGQSGPLAERGGHDINYIAAAGALDAFGRRDGPPVPPLNLVGDFAGGGLMLAFGILAALREADRRGEGQVVDCAMVDGVSHLMTAFHAPALALGPRGTNLLDTGHPAYEVYETADRRHVAVGALEPRFFDVLLAGLGLDPAEVPGPLDIARREELRAALAAAIARRTSAQLREVFDRLDACVTPVLTQGEAIAHPHSVAREAFVDVGGIVQPAPVPRFSRTPGRVTALPRPATAEECRREWAGSARSARSAGSVEVAGSAEAVEVAGLADSVAPAEAAAR
ncbi:hypothetical protein CcI49_20140 [Frankia sp. CcI49]|uniref:CaiB/BaiF CoA transferase family protein n=1 Tax=Frankia sp. CcI49 TaxID=1745382 RepID=UPI000975E746|nr:CaiB/BaiF CoA-transferase family protein [Frankia sp. CcI49]ONH58744.1 hypothetical protein CcI49_20140 [Frankia sp. CcI49]